MLDNLPTRSMLGQTDVDRLTGVIHTLLTEVASLSERVAALESDDGGQSTTRGPERISQLTARVLEPLLR